MVNAKAVCRLVFAAWCLRGRQELAMARDASS
jgi:hypothetical protein